MSESAWKERLRHSRLYWFSRDKLLDMLSADHDRWFQCVVTEPLPGDAVVTGVEYSFPHDAFRIRVTSRAFDAVPEGLMYPEYGPCAVNVRWDRVESMAELLP